MKEIIEEVQTLYLATMSTDNQICKLRKFKILKCKLKNAT